ncbi:colanic acid biosynthesis protein WcaM [Siccibacter colletis]|uniref:colanic acid biosynthesis protein WcaM n=1 Tax=Siccibacter colletis TaxID=1505757 RepID=UPI0004E19392|nr:colanic acid biosynthesis protein WcaM [Siccibacter colletis]
MRNDSQKTAFSTLSRRTLLQASSLLAVSPLLHSPLARAATGGDAVNVQDYFRSDWPDAFKRAFQSGKTVHVPADLVCDNINSAVWMPPGATLRIAGGMKGNGKGRFILQDGCSVRGEGKGRINNLVLDVRGSDCTIRDLEMTGLAPVALIYIGGKKKRVMNNFLVENLNVHDANYAILRQGFHNQMTNVRIVHCQFRRLQGDAIEWNVAINDRDLLISDHLLEDINCTNGKTNWGIGIGLAGSTYDNDYPEDQAVKHFVVANITGRNCRQLVHVENGKHFIIRNIQAENITPDFSKKAGIDNATVAIYGCDNFIIDHVKMKNSAGMLIGYGVVRGKYLSIPQNFKLNDVTLENGDLPWKLRGIQISSGNATSFVAITNLKMKRASLELHNKPQHLFLRNIDIMQEASRGPAMRLHFDLRKDVRGKFAAKHDTLLSMANINAVNEKGESSVDIDRLDHQHLNASTINFALPARKG